VYGYIMILWYCGNVQVCKKEAASKQAIISTTTGTSAAALGCVSVHTVI
jgi:hypothetical protein